MHKRVECPRKHTVLIISENRDERHRLCELFKRGEYRILWASSESQAHQRIQENPPCLILVDTPFVGSNGLALLKHITASPHWIPIPFMVLSNDPTDKEVQDFFALGMVDLVRKPFHATETRMRFLTQLNLHEYQVLNKESSIELQTIAQSTHDGIVAINEKGRIVFWNRTATQIFEFSHTEAMGKMLHQLIVPNRFWPRYEKHFLEFQSTGCGSAVRRTTELIAKKKNGEEIPVELSLSSVVLKGKRCAIGIVRDISERKQAASRLYLAEERFRTFFDNAPTGKCMADPSGTILHVNPALCHLLTISRDEILQTPLQNLLCNDANPTNSNLDLLLSGAVNMLVQDIVYPTKSGQENWIHSCTRLQRDAEGKPMYFLFHADNLTSVRQAEESLRESKWKLRAIFDQTNRLCGMLSTGGVLLEVNRTALEFAGTTEQEVLGKHFWETPWWTHDEILQEQVKDAVKVAAAGKNIRFEVTHKTVDGTLRNVDFSIKPVRDEKSHIAFLIVEGLDISERKRLEADLRKANEDFRNILECSPFGVAIISQNKKIIWVNKAARKLAGVESLSDIMTQTCYHFLCAEKPNSCPVLDLEQKVENVESTFRRSDGQEIPILKSIQRMVISGAPVLLETFIDITEQRLMATELGHARKLEAVGQLAAGIAHEINTPTQFVSDSVYYLRNSLQDLFDLITAYQQALIQLKVEALHTDIAQTIKSIEEKIDLEFHLSQTPKAVSMSLDGLERITKIVRAMKEFSHPDQSEKESADLNEALQNTLIIARNEIKYVAEVECDFGELPLVPCFLGDLNQVFLNLIVNAAHAIGDVVGTSGQKGVIRIRTTITDDHHVCIEIADTGTGIPEELHHKIFEPFFTTKEVGKGTGQGLTIARSIIVNKHGGSLTFTSEQGKGTTFIILLPLST